jgi:hypothetical protein
MSGVHSTPPLQVSINSIIDIDNELHQLISEIRDPLNREEFKSLNYRDMTRVSKAFLCFMDQHLSDVFNKQKSLITDLPAPFITDLTKFLWALKASNPQTRSLMVENNNEAEKIIKVLCQSKFFRFYMPEEIKKAKSVISTLFNNYPNGLKLFNTLYSKADIATKARLVDLLDNDAEFLQEAVTLTNRTIPNTLRDFIELTSFFQSYGKKLENELEDIHVGVPNKRRIVDTLVQQELQNSARCLNRYHQYHKAAQNIMSNNFLLQAVREDPNDISDISAKLCFASPSGLACHAVKRAHRLFKPNNSHSLHSSSLKEFIDSVYQETETYLQEARNTIKMAMRRIPPTYSISYCQFNRRKIFQFYHQCRNYNGDLLNLRTIVKFTREGEAYISTFIF